MAERRGNKRRNENDDAPGPDDPTANAGMDAGEGRPTLRAVPMFSDSSHWTPSLIAMEDMPDELAGPPLDRNRRGWVDEHADIDWALVRQLKGDSVDQVEAEIKKYRLRQGREPSTDDEREMGKPIIARVVADHARSEAAGGNLWPAALEERYFKAVFDSQFGFGRLQPLFEIPDAENITIHGCDSVKVHYADGTVEKLPPVADSDDELLEQLRQMGSNARPRRTLDAHNVDMTLMLGHQFRVHAISDEISVRPRVAIRQHLLTRISLGDLAVRGMMPEPVARFLDAAVRANLTVGVAGEQSAGKALAVDTPIPTPTGWTTMGKLRDGDTIFDDRGVPCRVVVAHPIQDQRPCFEVRFDDGSSIVADADHLWRVTRRIDRERKPGRSQSRYYADAPERARLHRAAETAAAEPDRDITIAEATAEVGGYRSLLQQEARHLGPVGHVRRTWVGYRGCRPWRDVATYSRQLLLKALVVRMDTPHIKQVCPDSVVLTTAEMAEGIWAHPEAKWRTRNYAIDLAGPLEYAETDQPVDPYLLGLWLGDGATHEGRITTADPDIIASIEALGYACTRVGRSKYDYGIRRLKAQLRTVGVLGDKHIPDVYLHGSVTQRLALLQGLMDSDGTCGRQGTSQFCATREVLARQVLELCRGLGFKPTLTQRPARLNGKVCGTSFTVSWTTATPVFRLQRKLERQSSNAGGPKRRYITLITPVPSVPVRCITVDSPTRLFLAGNACIPTHNTTFLRALIDAIPDDEAFGTMETDLELFSHLMPGRDNEMALFARTGMGERGSDGKRVGEIGISSLVDMGVRQYLRRFIVGEVRGSEASALFQAMAIGTGTMFTIHSRDPQTAPIRLASRVAEGRVYTVDEAMRQIGLLVDLIVYVEVIDDRHLGGTRRRIISQIAHCSPGEHGRPAISPLYTTDFDGNPDTFNPPPDMLAKLRRHTRASLPRREG